MKRNMADVCEIELHADPRKVWANAGTRPTRADSRQRETHVVRPSRPGTQGVALLKPVDVHPVQLAQRLVVSKIQMQTAATTTTIATPHERAYARESSTRIISVAVVRMSVFASSRFKAANWSSWLCKTYCCIERQAFAPLILAPETFRNQYIPFELLATRPFQSCCSHLAFLP